MCHLRPNPENCPRNRRAQEKLQVGGKRIRQWSLGFHLEEKDLEERLRLRLLADSLRTLSLAQDHVLKGLGQMSQGTRIPAPEDQMIMPELKILDMRFMNERESDPGEQETSYQWRSGPGHQGN